MVLGFTNKANSDQVASAPARIPTGPSSWKLTDAERAAYIAELKKGADRIGRGTLMTEYRCHIEWIGRFTREQMDSQDPKVQENVRTTIGKMELLYRLILYNMPESGCSENASPWI